MDNATNFIMPRNSQTLTKSVKNRHWRQKTQHICKLHCTNHLKMKKEQKRDQIPQDIKMCAFVLKLGKAHSLRGVAGIAHDHKQRE